MLFLVLASLFYYGWWNPVYLLVIVGSMLANYLIGLNIIRLRNSAPVMTKWLLAVGIGANLAVLGYFKYAGFILDNLTALFHSNIDPIHVVLPLAISFFTFQQIAFLVDASRGQCDDYNFIHYCLFVTFFPQLIAGPIVHHGEMMPQFARIDRSNRNEDFYVGISFFVFGLAKKVLIADNVAQWATPVFGAADAGQSIDSAQAWMGAIAYSLQLYFDFSGYADMAIGCARLFGIRLPLNFNSPYQATSIIEFWRRWHMTLSRFLRDYLYIPLGGNRKGTLHRHRNLMITMLLGGLWHGAGWNFVIWGGLHGSYLVINHLFRAHCPSVVRLPRLLTQAFGWSLTLFCIIIAWVFFRAESFDGASRMLSAMFLLSTGTATSAVDDPERGWQLIIVFSIIALFAPNTSRLLGYFGTENTDQKAPLWRPNPVTGLLISVLFLATAIRLSDISEFLYFQF
ncbi:MBOAT family O-acyltransferase [Ketobacter sp.]|uniref:MBOAT family O-acyltransferase n=1 Tax=Ketobacter sp. TaxID=2083498 RepID=UPI0025BB00D8|nr:MBOAT family protein [Ketobacter sp.]